MWIFRSMSKTEDEATGSNTLKIVIRKSNLSAIVTKNKSNENVKIITRDSYQNLK